MSQALMAGLVFWICVAFFGSRTMYIEERGALYHLLKPLKLRSSVALIILALVSYAIAFVLCNKEINAIQDQQGAIGFFFLISVVFGVIGSFFSSAYLFINSD